MPKTSKEIASDIRKHYKQRIADQAVTLFPVVLGLGVIFALNEYLPGLLAFSLGFFICGFTGVIILIRKETPTIFGGIRGARATMEGVFFIVFFWSGALYAIWQTLWGK